MLQRLESSRAAGQWSGAIDNSSYGSCSSFLAFDTDEAMSASSKMAQDVDVAMSESSWTALAKRKERDCWSVDLEGKMVQLEVVGPWSGTEGGSMDPKAVVVEGGEAHTINLCQQCYNEKLVQQGKPRLKLRQWKGIVEKKAHRGRIWNVIGNEQFRRGMWEYFTLKRAEARKILANAAQEGIQGQW